MLSPFIEDGYELDGVVPALVGLYEAIPFRYRPALSEEITAYGRTQGKGSPRQETDATVSFIEKHLSSWDLCNKRGEVVQPTADILRRCYSTVLTSLVSHICGYTAPQRESEKN